LKLPFLLTELYEVARTVCLCGANPDAQRFICFYLFFLEMTIPSILEEGAMEQTMFSSLIFIFVTFKN